MTEPPPRAVAADGRAAVLRRRIEIYRGHLREGVNAGLASDYLREIAAAEAELAELDRKQPG